MPSQSTPQMAIETLFRTSFGDGQSPTTRKRTISLLSGLSACASKVTVQFKVEPLVATAIRSGTHEAYGAFTPTPSASSSLCQFDTRTTGFFRRRVRTPLVWQDTWSEPSSPTSPSIPSISRTSSYISDSSSQDGPSAIHTLLETTLHPPAHVSFHSELNPILASLERKSKFCTDRVRCATCGKPGSDYPRCGKCGEMWCSRDCRLQGRRSHVCSRTTSF
ncbi:uncharacterized protein BT62DRAFT_349428 [Guyanagaster necrorhizus]|uniref:HIT-type domain-containing protein n=1 Tax=Guyanagaster necrorhizus TaxID=856835 RepID=A0A9P7VML7_9AGAR|nr:uncharacterized protein BT62DRAFT_349428 [Guyanagaster necrorhizus MCA 3950]KAG7443085.1 hypothetical protein BT62DRAFT_349428 [Guyanagaster necrorhizus MCA 3950]